MSDPLDIKKLSNQELIRRLTHAGPTDPAWSEFLGRFQQRLRLTVYRSVREETERNRFLDSGPLQQAVEDLLQEVFVRLLEREREALRRFSGRNENSIYTYLNAIAINLVRDHFKRLRALKKPPASKPLPQGLSENPETGSELAEALSSQEPSPERLSVSRDLKHKMMQVVSDSAPRDATARDRLIFRLYFIEGLTMDEVARIESVGLSASGVEKCVQRIRAAVRENFRENEGGLQEEKSSL